MTALQWLAITIAAVLIIEVITGWHSGIYRRHDIKVTAGCMLFGQITRNSSAMLYAGLFTLLIPAWQNVLIDAPFWPATIILLLIDDFVFYWVHRLAHHPKQRLLWGMHRTHHAAKYLNVSVMARVNIFWPFVVPTAWISGLGFYLGLQAQSAMMLVIILIWNAFTHSALRWDDLLARSNIGRQLLTVIEWFFITPRLHHTHHGWGKDGKAHRNFAVVFSFYDRLFGSLYSPSGRPAHYGVPGGDKHWAEEVFFPLLKQKAQPQSPITKTSH